MGMCGYVWVCVCVCMGMCMHGYVYGYVCGYNQELHLLELEADDAHETGALGDSEQLELKLSSASAEGYHEARKSRDDLDEATKVANRLVASAVAKAVQRIIMEGRMVRANTTSTQIFMACGYDLVYVLSCSIILRVPTEWRV